MESHRPEKETLDAATRLSKLERWLETRLDSLNRTRRRADPAQGIQEYQGLLQDLQSKEQILEEVINKVEELGNGSDPNSAGDFLGADKLPPVHETGELEDL